MKSVLLHLAGSVEMNGQKDWQACLVAALGDRNVTIVNPPPAPSQKDHLEWELDGLERADLVAMWFAPDTVAPITLLELGLAARQEKLVVGCADGFWRRSNIEVVCQRFAIPLTTSWAAFVAIVCAKLDQA